MRSQFLGYVIALTVSLAVSSLASAQPRNRKGSSATTTDKTIDKQMEWENKVMGDDAAKADAMKKIAAAQKLTEQAAKNPPPVQAPKPKDPNKEGVRAKQEAAIGLPIASDQEPRTTRKTSTTSKKSGASSSANDELGALVASSLAAEKAAPASAAADTSASTRQGRAAHGKGAGKGRAAGKSAAPSTLDQMFATSK